MVKFNAILLTGWYRQDLLFKSQMTPNSSTSRVVSACVLEKNCLYTDGQMLEHHVVIHLFLFDLLFLILNDLSIYSTTHGAVLCSFMWSNLSKIFAINTTYLTCEDGIWVFVVSTNSDLCSALVTAVLYAISCNLDWQQVDRILYIFVCHCMLSERCWKMSVA